MVMENLIKCGVRVHGGTGNGTLIRKKRLEISCWNASLVSFYLPVAVVVHYLRSSFRSYFSKSIGFFMFDDGETEWPWTGRVVSSEYACTYF